SGKIFLRISCDVGEISLACIGAGENVPVKRGLVHRDIGKLAAEMCNPRCQLCRTVAAVPLNPFPTSLGGGEHSGLERERNMAALQFSEDSAEVVVLTPKCELRINLEHIDVRKDAVR